MAESDVYRFEWRGELDNAAVNALHAEAFDHELLDEDWEGQVRAHSLGWACAYDDDGLVGFVNVAWDGGIHTFVIDTMVSRRAARRGVGTRLIAVVVAEARAAGCEWLHVDFEDHLRRFYFDACGFEPTNAGLIALHEAGGASREEAPQAHEGAQEGAQRSWWRRVFGG